MFIEGQKHSFEVGKFETFDVSHNMHFAKNQTAQPLTMLYIEYFPESGKPWSGGKVDA